MYKQVSQNKFTRRMSNGVLVSLEIAVAVSNGTQPSINMEFRVRGLPQSGVLVLDTLEAALQAIENYEESLRPKSVGWGLTIKDVTPEDSEIRFASLVAANGRSLTISTKEAENIMRFLVETGVINTAHLHALLEMSK